MYMQSASMTATTWDRPDKVKARKEAKKISDKLPWFILKWEKNGEQKGRKIRQDELDFFTALEKKEGGTNFTLEKTKKPTKCELMTRGFNL